MPKVKIKINKTLIFVILTLCFIFWQARIPLWNQHLQVDIWVWFERMQYWFNHRSFAGLEGSEFLPATLLYLFLPTFFIPFGWFSYSNYLPAALMVNLVLLGLHFILVQKYSNINHVWCLGLILLALGPILLFRFEPLATLTVILSLVAFQKKKYGLAGAFLGWATAIKIYPIIFLPYLILILRQNKVFKSILMMLIYFFEAIILSVLGFFLLGGDYQQIITALNFHNLKYVSIESLPGSLITLFSLITQNHPPQLLGGWGIWGITSPLIVNLGLGFFNRFWMLPVGIFYLYLLKHKVFIKQINFGIIFCLMLIFLVFSKNLHPQYIWWFLSLFPFIVVKPSGKKDFLILLILLLLISLVNQVVYPLFYTQFYVDFYQYNQQYWVYYCLLFRNFLIIVLTFYSLKSVLVKKNLL